LAVYSRPALVRARTLAGASGRQRKGCRVRRCIPHLQPVPSGAPAHPEPATRPALGANTHAGRAATPGARARTCRWACWPRRSACRCWRRCCWARACCCAPFAPTPRSCCRASACWSSCSGCSGSPTASCRTPSCTCAARRARRPRRCWAAHSPPGPLRPLWGLSGVRWAAGRRARASPQRGPVRLVAELHPPHLRSCAPRLVTSRFTWGPLATEGMCTQQEGHASGARAR